MEGHAMPSKPKLIGAAAAVTAATAFAAVIGLQAYDSGDSSPPAPLAVAPVAEQVQAAPAAEVAGPHTHGAMHNTAPGTAPMDVAMDHMTDAAPAQQVSRLTGGSSRPVFLVAQLNGRNEVPVAGGPAVGDRNGRAVQVIRIRGNQVSFATAFKGVAPPTANHIHEGVAGVNGAIKVNFFGTALPNGISAVTGSVTVDDAALLRNLARNPGKFYANLHTAEFPGGAVRAQFQRLNRPVDIERALDFGRLIALGNGKQEVPVEGGPAAGDRDGRSVGFLWANGGRIDYSLRWSRIAPPTLGHLHQGNAGVNGAVVADLFKAEQGLPATITGVAGTAKVDRTVTTNIAGNPRGFYTNLHTAEFPGGAVRGQLTRLR
jgi:hypothetical protein